MQNIPIFCFSVFNISYMNYISVYYSPLSPIHNDELLLIVLYYNMSYNIDINKMSPGAKIESPVFHPMISLILANTTFSMRINTGAIS